MIRKNRKRYKRTWKVKFFLRRAFARVEKLAGTGFAMIVGVGEGHA